MINHKRVHLYNIKIQSSLFVSRCILFLFVECKYKLNSAVYRYSQHFSSLVNLVRLPHLINIAHIKTKTKYLNLFEIKGKCKLYPLYKNMRIVSGRCVTFISFFGRTNNNKNNNNSLNCGLKKTPKQMHI